MELEKQRIRGNTWCVIQPRAIVPYYQLSETEIILLDSGAMLHGELEGWLDQQGLHVRAILNTHNHWDHAAANQRLRKEHGARVYMPVLEAAMTSTPLSRFEGHVYGRRQKIASVCEIAPFPVDETVGLEDGPVEVLGARFEVIHTPGHSLDHVAYRTPDDVLYVGDALMSDKLLRDTKINYALNWEVDLASKEKLRDFRCAAYVLAHGSVETELAPLIDRNIAYVHERAAIVEHMAERPVSMEQLTRAVWEHLGLRGGNYFKDMESAHMIRALAQYLVSVGRLDCQYCDGVEYYVCCGKKG